MKEKFYFFILFSILLSFANAQIPDTYDGKFEQKFLANKMAASNIYRVFVNGIEIDTYQSPIPASYAGFQLNDKQEANVEILVAKDVKWVDVRPRSANIHPVFKGNRISFKLNGPQKLSIEINGFINNPLFLFADKKKEKTIFDNNVIKFTGNKKHYVGILELNNNQSVYIEEGSVLVGVIYAKNANNIKVFGSGIIDGTYNNRLNDSLIKSGSFTGEQLSQMNGKYHRFLFFEDCKNVTVQDVTLHNSTSWEIVPLRCENVKIDNVKIISDQPGDDGIDIVSSKNVTVQNSFIRTKDDCIAIKSAQFLNPPQNVENILVKNNVLWNAAWGNAIEIGFELDSKEVKEILFEDNDIIHVESGAAISIHYAGKAHVKNITFKNIRIEDARQKFLDLAIFRSKHSIDKPANKELTAQLYRHGAWDGVVWVPKKDSTYHSTFRGKISNITFQDIKIIDGQHPFSLFSGDSKKNNIQNIIIENLWIHNKKINNIKDARLYHENTENIIFR